MERDTKIASYMTKHTHHCDCERLCSALSEPSVLWLVIYLIIASVPFQKHTTGGNAGTTLLFVGGGFSLAVLLHKIVIMRRRFAVAVANGRGHSLLLSALCAALR